LVFKIGDLFLAVVVNATTGTQVSWTIGDFVASVDTSNAALACPTNVTFSVYFPDADSGILSTYPTLVSQATGLPVGLVSVVESEPVKKKRAAKDVSLDVTLESDSTHSAVVAFSRISSGQIPQDSATGAPFSSVVVITSSFPSSYGSSVAVPEITNPVVTVPSGLSDGAVAGIVVGSVIGGLLLIALLIFVIVKVSRGSSKPSSSSSSSSSSRPPSSKPTVAAKPAAARAAAPDTSEEEEDSEEYSEEEDSEEYSEEEDSEEDSEEEEEDSEEEDSEEEYSEEEESEEEESEEEEESSEEEESEEDESSEESS
jgi:hypothetical protein